MTDNLHPPPLPTLPPPQKKKIIVIVHVLIFISMSSIFTADQIQWSFHPVFYILALKYHLICIQMVIK